MSKITKNTAKTEFEYFLVRGGEWYSLGKVMLQETEDADDAFPRFLEEILVRYPDIPCSNILKFVRPGEEQIAELVANLLDRNSRYRYKKCLNWIKMLLLEAADRGATISAWSADRSVTFHLLFKLDGDDAFYGRESTMRFLGIEFAAAS